MKKILICGMGAIGHSIAATIKADQIDVLVSKKREMDVVYSEQLQMGNKINQVFTYETIGEINYDMVILTLPYRFKIAVMSKLLPKISKRTTIVIVPANQGILSYLPAEIYEYKLVLFERVPHISRVKEYGKLVNIYGTKSKMNLSLLNGASQNEVVETFCCLEEVIIHENAIDISLITSNAVIHSARIYNLFKNDDNFAKDVRFYFDWTDTDSELFIELETEILQLIKVIENKVGIEIDYYDMLTHFGVDVKNPKSNELTANIQNDESFKPIIFRAENKSDLAQNRYVVDDMLIGIDFYLALAEKYQVELPTFMKLNDWARKLVETTNPEIIEELKTYKLDVAMM